MTPNMTKAFFAGIREGVTMFAYWKDGVQYVGTTGKTLAKAIEQINDEEAERLSSIENYEQHP